METNRYLILLIITIIFLVIDSYTYKGLKLALKGLTNKTISRLIKCGYWVWSIGVLVIFVLIFTNFEYVLGTIHQSKSYFLPFSSLGLLLINVIPKLLFIVFHLIEDIGWLGYKGIKKVTTKIEPNGEVMDRFTFLTRLGLGVAAIQFSGILYGITKGKFNFKIRKESLSFNNLPNAFEGLNIVQISDLHIGSFFKNYDEIEYGINLINDLKPDVIFITGDLINNYAWELDGWGTLLKKLQAKYGIYSILGNHDYGDYVQWDSEIKKKENLAKLEYRQKQLGFRLLKNESVRLEKNGQFIDLIGVENWGTKSFVNYGDLPKAMKQTSLNSFKILLSHDPTHWEEQVMNKTNIDLTFSGHTHGMQMGIEIPGFRWSPAQYLYKFWAGLYQVNKQYLYVNRGFGYTLFPGRIGIKPEITQIQLYKKV